MSETTQTTTETPVPTAPVVEPTAAAPLSFIARWRADVEAAATAIGVEADKLWALVKEHM